jgi:hypothetical protein
VNQHRRLRHTVTGLIVGLLAVGCGSSTDRNSPFATASESPTTSAASASLASPTSAPSPSTTPNTSGFAFAAEDIATFYETQGYTCSASTPSTKAAGFTYRTCQLVDPQGRTRVVGFVTDPAGGLADAFASVEGTETETVLDPTVALDPLSGFLGALLGEGPATELLPWLAGHLGDTYAQTTSGILKVATYTAAEDDHSTLFVEAANPAYLAAPTPSLEPASSARPS